jgi:hypothetical protein
MSIATLQAQNDAAWASEMLTAQRDTMPTAVLGADQVTIYHVEEGVEPHGVYAGWSFFPAGFKSAMQPPPGEIPRSPITSDKRPAMADLIQGQLDSPTVDVPLPSGDLLRVKGTVAGRRRMPGAISHLSGDRFVIQGGRRNGAYVFGPSDEEGNVFLNNGQDFEFRCPRGATVVVGVMGTWEDPIPAQDFTFVTQTYTAQERVTFRHPRTGTDWTVPVSHTVFNPIASVTMSRDGSWTVMGHATIVVRA